MVFIKDEIKRLKQNLIENNTGIDVYLYNYINNDKWDELIKHLSVHTGDFYED